MKNVYSSTSKSKNSKSKKDLNDSECYLFEDDTPIIAELTNKKINFKSSKINTLEIIEPTKTNIIIKDNNKDIIIETFEKHFTGKTIKKLQYDIVNSIINKLDTVGILPTGYGKSICYQLPYLLNPNKVVIIVSPLISLMEDQKEKLEKLNIPVACFHSNVGKKKKQEVKNEIFENLLSEDSDSDNSGIILFLTPEYLINCENWIKQLAKADKLALVAFDEAHCISTWGHDFRPDYQGLYRIKEWCNESDNKIPLLALTATATKDVEEDIKTFLQLENPLVFKTSFDRPNLIIGAIQKPKEFNILFPILNKYSSDFSIIYCKTRDRAEELSTFLQDNDYNADVYHAGLSAKSRQEIQEKFSNRELNIIVATVAFGMGIDQNIHLVVHWGCPSDMESYYQEIGRAGRDGIESECIMYYDKDDFRISRYFLRSISDISHRKFKDEQISKMERYCMLPTCRRKTLLSHFGEVLDENYICNKCDNCSRQNGINDIAINNLSYPIFIIAKTVFLVKCKMGTTKICLLVRGSKAKSISDFNKYITYGTLKELNDDQIKTLISIMVINGYLKEKTIISGFGTVLETTSKLVQWYSKINNRIGSNSITFDNLYSILNEQNNKLTLNIPVASKDITKIKFKTSIEDMIDTFDLEDFE